jgi:hypothetical protein
MSETHPFYKLTELIDTFNKERNNLDLRGLQDLRENIALTLFYLSDSVSMTIANAESNDFLRKRFYAEKEEFYRNSIDERTGKLHNVADSERKARLDCKEVDDNCAHAFKQKERARLVVLATQQILNSISGRIAQLTK